MYIHLSDVAKTVETLEMHTGTLVAVVVSACPQVELAGVQVNFRSAQDELSLARLDVDRITDAFKHSDPWREAVTLNLVTKSLRDARRARENQLDYVEEPAPDSCFNNYWAAVVRALIHVPLADLSSDPATMLDNYVHAVECFRSRCRDIRGALKTAMIAAGKSREIAYDNAHCDCEAIEDHLEFRVRKLIDWLGGDGASDLVMKLRVLCSRAGDRLDRTYTLIPVEGGPEEDEQCLRDMKTALARIEAMLRPK